MIKNVAGIVFAGASDTVRRRLMMLLRYFKPVQWIDGEYDEDFLISHDSLP